MLSSPFFQNVVMVWLVPAILVVIAVIFQWPVIRNMLYERKLLRTINKYGRETFHDVMLPDGIDGMTYIEHLVLTADAIVVLYLKRYRGIIFSGDNIEEWTQVVNRNSYRFPNPLRQLEMEVMAVQNIAEDVKIVGQVIFTDESSFPKGKPERVKLFSEFEGNVKDYQAGEIPAKLQTAWKRLADNIEPCGQEFLKNMHETRHVKGNGFLSGLSIVIAVFWLGWQLLL